MAPPTVLTTKVAPQDLPVSDAYDPASDGVVGGRTSLVADAVSLPAAGSVFATVNEAERLPLGCASHMYAVFWKFVCPRKGFSYVKGSVFSPQQRLLEGQCGRAIEVLSPFSS